jgi:hypothetical protein
VRWFVRAVVLICVCAGSRIGLGAQDARPTGRRVELMIGASANEADLLAPSIREMLAPKGLSVVTTRKSVVTAQDVAAAIAPPGEATPSLARVLLDFTVAGQATLFLIDPPRGRVYVRRMALAHGVDAVARASVRFVIEQSIDAILEGREIGVSRDEFQRSGALASPPASPPPPQEAPAPAAPVPAAPPASAPTPARTQLLLAAGYQLQAMGSGEFQHAGKLAIAARFDRVVIALAARLAAPISVAGDGVSARLTTAGVSASGAGRILDFAGFAILAGLGASLDFTHVAPTVTTPGLTSAEAFWALGPSLTPFSVIERFFGRISIALAAGAEIHLLDERYAVKTATETRNVFVPGRVRPQVEALVGIAF